MTGRGSPAEVFGAFLRLGLTAFGGPVAHLGYFRTAFVARRGWLDAGQFAEIVALCSFLPGPTSSQTGVAIGLGRAGWGGALAAWVGFTLPSAVLMTGVALAAGSLHGPVAAAVIHGLKLAAVAVVAQAVIAMARALTPDWPRRGVAMAAAAIVVVGGPWGQVAAIVAGAVAGQVLGAGASVPRGSPTAVSRRLGVAALAGFALLLAGLPLVAAVSGARPIAIAAAAYRAGALVFGGGHVVLPLLQSALVPRLVGTQAFLAGYGAAQALPGPLFTFAAYLGALVGGAGAGSVAGGVGGAVVALVAIFAPGMVLLAAALPVWAGLQARPGARAAVVGILAAALISPVGTGAIHGAVDAGVAAAGFAALLGRVPPWAVVAGCVVAALAI